MPVSSDTSSARLNRVLPLDGLRTIAIVLVVLYHLHMPFFTGGFVGVNIFYARSGYLITSILLREHGATDRIRLGRFWLRRLLRLYPGLVAVVIVAVCLWFLVGDYEGANVDSVGAALLALTYTANFGRWLWHRSMGVLSQTWSLAMEEQFYLVWPPVLALLLARRARRVAVLCVLVVLIVASSVGGWLLYAPHAGGATPDVYFSPVLNVGPLLMGCVLALLLASGRVRRVLDGRVGALCTWVGLVAVLAIQFAMPHDWQKHVVVFALVLPVAGLASTLLVAGLVSRGGILTRVLSFAPLAWFGRAGSYSLYLWHVIVLALLLPVFPGVGGKFIVFGAAVALSIGSHFAIERPFLALKNRLEPRARPGREPTVPEAPRELVARR
jgi:peptidoglycan/LPS O-acetylase OafA/YrhL